MEKQNLFLTLLSCMTLTKSFYSLSLFLCEKNGNAINSSLNMVDMFCDLKGNDE